MKKNFRLVWFGWLLAKRCFFAVKRVTQDKASKTGFWRSCWLALLAATRFSSFSWFCFLCGSSSSSNNLEKQKQQQLIDFICLIGWFAILDSVLRIIIIDEGCKSSECLLFSAFLSVFL